MVKKYKMISFLLVSLFLVFSCNTSNADVSDIRANQKKILTKLEKIEKLQLGLKTSIATINKPSPNKKQQQKPQVDPNKVYDVAIGDSYIEGNPNAPITIIEWMDFQ